MKPRIYIETSVISYLTARPSRNILTLARQTFTSAFWEMRDTSYTPFISALVTQEIARGDVSAAELRLNTSASLPMLEIDTRVETLAQLLITQKAVPQNEVEDALHIATAVTHRMDYIATWNFVHLVGASAKYKLQKQIAELGYAPPLFATPEEILEELK